LNLLNFVSLLTAEASGAPYVLEVDFRSSSVSGAVLETSDPILISPPSPTTPVTTLFTFPEPVSLVPGDLYVIQVLQLSGEGLIGSSGTNNYVSGTQILGGIPQPENDLWFQEGIISTPEPEMLLLLAIGLIGLTAATLCGRPGKSIRRSTAVRKESWSMALAASSPAVACEPARVAMMSHVSAPKAI
jgi:hypothetical protein